MATWEQTRVNKENNKTVNVFNQIDYIICQTSQKNILMNARSYSGTQVNSDHRLVVARMRTEPYHLHKIRKQKTSRPINTARLHDPEIRTNYEQNIKKQFQDLQNKQHEHVQQKWNEAVSTLTKTAEEIIGMKNTVNNNNNRTHDDEIDKMSNEQKKLRLLISSCIDVEKVQNMRTDRNILFKEIKKKTLENREGEIDKMVREIDKIQDEAKMFKAVKTLSLCT